jgi:hypothetical protein
MSPYRDPPRWKSDFAGADPTLRRALRAATRDRPSRADVKWMEAALSLRLDPTAARPNVKHPPAALAAPPAAKTALLAKAASVLLIGSTIGAVGFLAARKLPVTYLPVVLQTRASEPPPPSVPEAQPAAEPVRTTILTMQHADRRLVLAAHRPDPRPTAPRTRERNEPRSNVPIDAPGEAPLAGPVPTSEAPLQAPTPTVEATPPPQPAPVKELTETEVLMMARRSLASDPAGALRWVREHERRFSSPALTQEREIIAIDALRRLDRTREATARSERFFARYPSSIHGRSIESPVASQK